MAVVGHTSTKSSISPTNSGNILSTIKKIGDGLQATVYTAKTLSSLEICVKVFDLGASKDALLSAKKEYEIGKLLKGHENIVQIESFKENQLIKVNG